MLLGLYEVSVHEGSSIIITRAHFDSTELLQRLHAFQQDIAMTFHFVTLPLHGNLYLNDVEVTSLTTFTQKDIDAERLRYNHDDSDTTRDIFSFSVNIKHHGDRESPAPGHVLNFSIEVIPVNDQQFRLVTQNPSLRVSLICQNDDSEMCQGIFLGIKWWLGVGGGGGQRGGW